MSTTTGYSRLQIALHWAIAALIVANYLISEGMEDAFDGMMEGSPVAGFVPSFHVWAGVAVLVLAVIRLVVRMASGAPEAGSSLGDIAASWMHRALYALMIAVPALGAITWFGGIDATADFHVLAMNAMMLLALGHAAMALLHQFVLKDGLLVRMLRAR